MEHSQDDLDYLNKCLSIDALQLAEEFTEVSSQLSYWNEQYAEALRTQLVAKIHRERTHALVYLQKRESMGKVTEATLSAAIEIDPRYVVAVDTEAQATADCMKMRGRAEAVKTKRDMLVSLGAHMRAEMGGDPSIRRRDTSYTEQDPISS